MSTTIGREPMSQWRLRESDKEVVVVKDGKYGLPVMHRDKPCQTHPLPSHPVLSVDVLGFDVVQLAWRSEQMRTMAGLAREIDFCVHCMSERA